MITVDTATEKDIKYFVQNIRDMDKEEVYLGSGKSIEDAMKDWCDYNTQTVKCNGVIIGVGGVLPNEDRRDSARVWLLLTNDVLNHKIEFLRWSKKWHDEILKQYKYIYNNVYMKNVLHIKYLQWLGAQFYPYFGGEWAFFVIKNNSDKKGGGQDNVFTDSSCRGSGTSDWAV